MPRLPQRASLARSKVGPQMCTEVIVTPQALLEAKKCTAHAPTDSDLTVLLARIRAGANLYELHLDFPRLMPAQMCLVQRLQALEAKLYDLYQQIECLESARIEAEHNLTRSLLQRANQGAW